MVGRMRFVPPLCVAATAFVGIARAEPVPPDAGGEPPPAETTAATSDEAPAVPESPLGGDAPVVAPAEPARAEAKSGAAVSEVRVRGKPSETERLKQSADAVSVVDTRRAKQETVDLGEVLARTQGVAVRRTGGLGSGTRFALNGFQDDQVRFFVDGVPLERAGYPNGIANVPVNLVERVEVYRGVVPVRLGADALGGAVNLVSETRYSSRLGASYQVGSFGTYRATAAGRYRHPDSGFVVGASGYVDTARNDYLVDVEVTNTRGQLVPARVRRFHDGYRAYGARAEVGVVDKSWAKKLVLEGFVAGYDKDLQNNIVMTIPYGEARYGEVVSGATARWDTRIGQDVDVNVVANFAHRNVHFSDTSEWLYDWFGRRLRQRRVPGEITDRPIDQRLDENSGFARAVVAWRVGEGHALRGSITPSYTARTGEDRALEPGSPDPLDGRRSLLTTVTGLEYQLDAFRDRLENVVFVKDYVYAARGRELSQASDQYVSRDRDDHALGAGDALRVRVTPWFYAKASYEWATRLPRVDELFGNGVLVLPNLSLLPERSHNANLGPHFEWKKTALGSFILDLNVFYRESSRLIALLGTQVGYQFDNVFGARGVGLENAVAWSSPGRWISLDGTFTWQDLRNTSGEGAFGVYQGDRIPNRPYLFGSWGARGHVPKVGFATSTLEPFYYGRWVDSFYRAWESAGIAAFKQTVDSQLTHDLGSRGSSMSRWPASRRRWRSTT